MPAGATRKIISAVALSFCYVGCLMVAFDFLVCIYICNVAINKPISSKKKKKLR
jgi:hypothetical protein